MKLPEVRKNLLTQDLEHEVLVYNLATDKSHCLNSTARVVFDACNGKNTVIELQAASGLSEEMILLTLEILTQNDLIRDDYELPATGLTRREAVKRAGLASMAALPVISTLLSPTAANAASGALLANGQSCSSGGQCLSSNCSGSRCCSGSYISSSSCTSIDDCCFGGNGVIFCQTNAAGQPNRCCSTAACVNNAQCCAGRTCNNGTCRLAV